MTFPAQADREAMDFGYDQDRSKTTETALFGAQLKCAL
jgi:hypothetical protein